MVLGKLFLSWVHLQIELSYLYFSAQNSGIITGTNNSLTGQEDRKAEATTVKLYGVMEVNDVRGINKRIFIASARILGKAKRSNWIIQEKCEEKQP